MRHLNEYQHHLRVLLEPYDAKVSRTVLRGESPSNGADLLDKMGHDSYLPDNDDVEYVDVKTGNRMKENLHKMNGKKFHEFTLLFSHQFKNGWHLQWNTRYNYVRGMDNLGIFEAGIKETTDGPTQQRMSIMCTSNATDLLSTAELTKTIEHHSLRLGLNQWTSWQQEWGSSFVWAHSVEKNPKRILMDGSLTWDYNLCGEYYRGWDSKTVLYATDDWMINKRWNVYYGVRMESASLGVNSANNEDGKTNNSRTNGYYVESSTSSLKHRNKSWINPVVMAQVYYQFAKKWHLTGEYVFNRQHPMAVNFKYAELPVMAALDTQLGRFGFIFSGKYFTLNSLFSVISKTGYNGAAPYTKLINDEYETKTGFSLYDIVTFGWTTDAVLTYRGFNLHTLITFQNPRYKNFNNKITFSDGSVVSLDYSDNVVSGISKTLLEIDPSYEWNNWRLWMSMRYYSKQYANKLNNVWFNGHWETFAGVEYRSSKRYTVSLNVVNLLNQTGANGTIDVADTITDDSILKGYLTSGTFIRPFTVEMSVKYEF